MLIWAENIFLVCSSMAALQLRMDEVQQMFAELGLGFSGTSLECLRNPYVESEAAAGLTVRRRFVEVASLRVLGVMQDVEGATRVMTAHREWEAWKVGHKHSAVLCVCPMFPSVSVLTPRNWSLGAT